MLESLFRQMESRDATHTTHINISMLEIYNEHIEDLLINYKPMSEGSENDRSGSTPGPHKESSQGGKKAPNTYRIYNSNGGTGPIEVKGLTWWNVSSCETYNDLFAQGAKTRRQAHTNVHDRSSRSHCIISLRLHTRNNTSGLE